MLTCPDQPRPAMAERLRANRTPLAALIAAALLLCGGTASLADETEAMRSEREAHQAALTEIRQNLEESEEYQSELAAEIETLRDDRTALNDRLLTTARRIGDAESKIALLEGRIDELVERQGAVRESLRGRSDVLAELLGALQRMGRQPPPAVLVNPEDALRTVRSAILLGGVLPELRAETEVLATDLEELMEIEEDIAADREALVAETEQLERERLRVSALMEAKQRSMEEAESELADLRRRAAELAEEAEDMRELIASLDREISMAAEDSLERARQRSPEEALAALRDPGRMEPAMAFDAARGRLPKPASGVTVRDFGEPDRFDSPARGLSIATRPGAQVTSPGDGWVVYAGPFRSYGELLIINVGDGYHILLAGMAGIAVELGQFVLTGEPVGTMGATVVASAEDVTVGEQQPVLYVEFRKDGQSIDPTPWWADDQTGASG